MSVEAPTIPEEAIPQPSEFAVLTERDQKLLEESGRNLIEKFLADYPDKLPDAIVFPDITARPLFYLSRPTLERVSQERKIALPAVYFFATDRPKELESVRRIEAVKPGLGKKILESSLANYAESKKKVDALRATWRARAQEIEGDLAQRGASDPKIVIFDDFFVEGRTSGEISQSFGKKLPLYAFLAPATEETIRKAGFNVTVGKPEYKREEFDYTSYGGHEGIAIGVKKSADQPARYVEQDITTSNLAEVRGLREDMAKIGRKIAQELT